jgi:hypothetical protein
VHELRLRVGAVTGLPTRASVPDPAEDRELRRIHPRSTVCLIPRPTGKAAGWRRGAIPKIFANVLRTVV